MATWLMFNFTHYFTLRTVCVWACDLYKSVAGRLSSFYETAIYYMMHTPFIIINSCWGNQGN